MGRATSELSRDRAGEVVPIGVEPPTPPPGPPPRSSKLHTFALFTTAFAAVVSILAAIVFVTVNWSGPTRRIVIAVLMGSIVMFLAGVSSTILTAARDTYAHDRR